MTKLQKVLPKRQHGATFLSMVMLAALIGIVLLTVLKLAPAYMDNNVVLNAVEGVLANNNVSEMSINEVRSEAMKTVNINGVSGFSSESIVYTQEGSFDYIDINYERRVSLFYNIDAVVKFENRLER